MIRVQVEGLDALWHSALNWPPPRRLGTPVSGPPTSPWSATAPP